MKKLIPLLISGALVASMVGCGNTANISSSSGNVSSNTEPIKIGVIQLAEHAALDDAYRGFVDALEEAGFEDGKNIKLDFNNAQGDPSNCVTISTKLVNNKSDIILAIATPAAQAVANATKDIPILVTAVTDPADARLVASNEAPGGNVTGTSDLTPIKEQLALLKELLPEAKKVGFMYSSSEDNSLFQIEIARKEAEALGLTVVDGAVSSPNEIPQAAQVLAGKVDVIYIPTDNMLSAALPAVTQVTAQANIPVIGADVLMVKNGAVATRGLSYYELGKQTGRQAVKILKEGAKPANMPIEYLQNVELAVNEEMAQKLGIKFPQSILDQLAK